MATSQTVEPSPASQSAANHADGSNIGVFDLMCQRMRGTVTILGDIVSSDPDDLDREGE